MNKTYYMGSFPPPYGGVTVKNELLYGLLKDKIEMRIKQKFTIWSTLEALLLGNRFILAVGHTKHLLLLSSAIAILRPKAMRRSVVFAMGGNLADMVEGKPHMIRHLQRYRQVYIEPKRMLHQLQSMGLNNVSLLPNCRMRPQKEFPILETARPLRCVFFSRVSPDKGVDVVIEAAHQLKNVEFHIYGELSGEYSETFHRLLQDSPNVQYHGVFTGRNEEVYEELQKYDVMLFPSRWAFEGVPGILVEAKIAGVPAIVSDICYNAEIVEDGVSGIVLKENTADVLAEAIDRLDKDRQLLYAFKCGAEQSAEEYYIENYMDEILKTLEDRT